MTLMNGNCHQFALLYVCVCVCVCACMYSHMIQNVNDTILVFFRISLRILFGFIITRFNLLTIYGNYEIIESRVYFIFFSLFLYRSLVPIIYIHTQCQSKRIGFCYHLRNIWLMGFHCGTMKVFFRCYTASTFDIKRTESERKKNH